MEIPIPAILVAQLASLVQDLLLLTAHLVELITMASRCIMRQLEELVVLPVQIVILMTQLAPLQDINVTYAI